MALVDIQRHDLGESVSLMEPLLIASNSHHRGALNDLAIDLAQKSAGFQRSLSPRLRSSLAKLVRVTNSYYSNLLEGYEIHPADVERALKNDYSQDLHMRDLQLEAKAHVAVQEWISGGALNDGRSFQAEAVVEIHRRLFASLPEDRQWIADRRTGEEIRALPGELRKRDVRVGDHFAISPGAVSRFLESFETVYRNLGKADRIVSIPAAHHRLMWMRPFMRGNEPIARLVTHAMLLDVLDTGAVWSASRGLAQNAQKYRTLLDNCYKPRRNRLDGNGTLSEEALAEFTQFFLKVCIDQVDFMEGLLHPTQLRPRVLLWAEREIGVGQLPPKSDRILEAVLLRGELPRGEIDAVVGTGDRQARRIVTALLDKGLLVCDSPRGPLHLAFSATLAAHWMPRLFPEELR